MNLNKFFKRCVANGAATLMLFGMSSSQPPYANQPDAQQQTQISQNYQTGNYVYHPENANLPEQCPTEVSRFHDEPSFIRTYSGDLEDTDVVYVNDINGFNKANAHWNMVVTTPLSIAYTAGGSVSEGYLDWVIENYNNDPIARQYGNYLMARFPDAKSDSEIIKRMAEHTKVLIALYDAFVDSPYDIGSDSSFMNHIKDCQRKLLGIPVYKLPDNVPEKYAFIDAKSGIRLLGAAPVENGYLKAPLMLCPRAPGELTIYLGLDDGTLLPIGYRKMDWEGVEIVNINVHIYQATSLHGRNVGTLPPDFPAAMWSTETLPYIKLMKDIHPNAVFGITVMNIPANAAMFYVTVKKDVDKNWLSELDEVNEDILAKIYQLHGIEYDAGPSAFRFPVFIDEIADDSGGNKKIYLCISNKIPPGHKQTKAGILWETLNAFYFSPTVHLGIKGYMSKGTNRYCFSDRCDRNDEFAQLMVQDRIANYQPEESSSYVDVDKTVAKLLQYAETIENAYGGIAPEFKYPNRKFAYR